MSFVPGSTAVTLSILFIKIHTMKTFILFFYLSLISSQPVFAFNKDSVDSKLPDSASSPKKVCSCELVKLSQQDYKTETVALFAEKTNGGKLKMDYKITSFELWKEKKYLSTVFVYNVELIEKIKEASDCLSLYEKLKLKYKGLRMHSIIDMDIHSVVMR